MDFIDAPEIQWAYIPKKDNALSHHPQSGRGLKTPPRRGLEYRMSNFDYLNFEGRSQLIETKVLLIASPPSSKITFHCWAYKFIFLGNDSGL
jgi:hypothetical protein